MALLEQMERTASRRISVSSRARSARHGIVPVALILVIGFLVVLPLIRLQTLAFEDGAAAYRRAADVPDLGAIIGTTIALACGSVVIAMALGVSLAWASTRLPHGARWLAAVPLLPIVIPAVANVTGWVFLFAPRTGYVNSALRTLPFFSGDSGPVDIYTVPWIIIVTGFGLTSFVYVFVRAGLANVGSELEEAARVSGMAPGKAFFAITLPLLRPVLVYGGGIALLLGLGQFTAPLLLGTRNNIRVITTQVYTFTSEPPVDYGVAAALASPLLVFGLIIVVVQRIVLGDQSRFVTHGGRAFRGNVRTSRWAVVPIAVFGVIGIALPLGALVVVSLSPFYSADIDAGSFTLANFRSLFDDPQLSDAIRTSIVTSLGGVLLALPIGYVVTNIIYHRRWPRLSRLLDLMVNLPLGVPAVVFGAGFLFVYTKDPFVLYGTRWVIVLVYVTLMLPYATRLLLASRMALGDQYTAAARVSGAGPFTVAWRIVLPLMRPALAGAAALMFVLLTHEFAASLLVRSAQTQVMGTQLFTLWTTGSYPQVAAMAVVMCVITAIGVIVAMAFGRGAGTLEKL